jgi:hypothetical protein
MYIYVERGRMWVMVLCPPFLWWAWVGELGGFSSALLMEELKSEKKKSIRRRDKKILIISYHTHAEERERERER